MVDLASGWSAPNGLTGRALIIISAVDLLLPTVTPKSTPGRMAGRESIVVTCRGCRFAIQSVWTGFGYGKEPRCTLAATCRLRGNTNSIWFPPAEFLCTNCLLSRPKCYALSRIQKFTDSVVRPRQRCERFQLGVGNGSLLLIDARRRAGCVPLAQLTSRPVIADWSVMCD